MTVLILFLRGLSLLPLSILHPLASLLSWLLQHVFHYRSEVIWKNLKASFPAKSNAELKKLVGEYYVHMGALILETIKIYSMSKEELLQRCQFINPEILSAYETNGKNVLIMMGHSGNWEWAGLATQLRFQFQVIPVYRKIKNKPFNRYYLELRSRFGTKPMLDKEVTERISEATTPHVFALLADHTPGARKGWWTSFLNQKTPFHRGSEILARQLGYDVVFAHVRRNGRGRYLIKLELADSNWRNNPHKLTLDFIQFLEGEIQNDIPNWLWSHNRWKHQPSEKSHWID